MFLYDWNKIFEASEGNPTAVYLIFKMMHTAQIPRNKYDKIFKYSVKNFSGESFLAHPDVLLYNAYKHSYREIAQYLALASMRSCAEYLATGKTKLSLQECTVDLELFENNSLLHIEDEIITFIYEEVPKEKH